MTVRTDARKATNLMLPADLVASVDAIAGPRGRSRFIEEATREALHRDRLRSMHARVAGALSSSDYPHWATADDVQSWVRASRAEVAEAPDGAGWRSAARLLADAPGCADRRHGPRARRHGAHPERA